MSDSGRTRSPVAPGDIIGGKYRVERVLGAGGMGVVVAARHVELDQPVALKFVLPEALAGKGNLERFLREARAVVKLKSEHVARVYDVGREGDQPYMVLELLEGTDLSKLHKREKPLPVADVAEYVVQACEALAEAHAVGIIHRDLKPHNLFLTTRLNGTPLVKVLDFGISKAVGPAAAGQMQLTDSAAVIGSPVYMAPEQMRSARAADVRTDIWALGVVLYELLACTLPFDGETVTEVCIRVVNDDPKPLAELRPDIAPALARVVMRCLEKAPSARFQSVAELGAALEPFSRSAVAGGAPRVWRAVEAPRGALDAGVNVRAAARAMADETGPATAISFTDAAVDVLPPSDPIDVASTDVNWAEATTRDPRPPRRTFVAGIGAGIVASLAIAAVVVSLVWTRATPATPAAAAAGPSVAASSVGLPAAPPPPASTALLAEPAPEPTADAPASASPPTRPHAAASPPRRAPKTEAKQAPTATSPATATAAPAPAAPNGAPILR